MRSMEDLKICFFSWLRIVVVFGQMIILINELITQLLLHDKIAKVKPQCNRRKFDLLIDSTKIFLQVLPNRIVPLIKLKKKIFQKQLHYTFLHQKIINVGGIKVQARRIKLNNKRKRIQGKDVLSYLATPIQIIFSFNQRVVRKRKLSNR